MIKFKTDYNLEDGIQYSPEYLYMTIPPEYACIYHKLLIMLADMGIDMLADCQAGCNGKNKNVMNCWNMFQAACASHQLGLNDRAKTLINYIKAQIKNIYRGTGKEEHVGNITMPITDDGYLKAIMICGDSPTFVVDAETAELIEKRRQNGEYNDEYALGIEDEN